MRTIHDAARMLVIGAALCGCLVSSHAAGALWADLETTARDGAIPRA